MKIILNFIIALTLLAFNVEDIYAQQPGAKDCVDAIPLLTWETTTYSSVAGEGVVLNEVNYSMSCLSSGERNSSWFKFYTTGDGLVNFNINPSCGDADYDFAVFDITNLGCAGIATNAEVEVSCNFSGSTFPTPATGANGGPFNQDEPPIAAETGRIYVLLVNSFTGQNFCDYTLDFSGSTAQLGNFNEVIGHVNYDFNDVCGDGIESPGHNQRINLINESGDMVGYSYSNEDGGYNAYLPSGETSVSVVLAEVLTPFEPSCFPSQQTVTFSSDTGQIVANVDFAIRPTQLCSQYDFDYTALLFRRCFSTTNSVRISNLGTTNLAMDFTLTYPSEQVFPLSASVPFENIGNNTYLFHAPPIDVFQQLIVSISDTTTCENQLGSFICVEGELLNANDCYDENDSPLKLALSSDSVSNLIVVRNFGETPMPNYFTLYVNNDFDTLNNMFQTSNSIDFLLQSNESFSTGVFSENWTSVVVDNQGNAESIFISNIGNAAQTDTLVNLPYQTFDLECAMVFGSYDPNDKQGFPEGFGELNRIEKAQAINYRIRFQNTGSDTAFTVVILDTLGEYFDLSSIVPGASSHPYTFYHEENIIKFRFNNIDLVQKSLNEEASIGFVEFRIKQKLSNPISYTIENQAAIYFDFNDPIYTPVHQYSIYPLPLGIDDASQIEMNVSPNPSAGSVAFNFTNKWQGIQKTILVSDLSGRTIKSIETADNVPGFNWNGLPAGTYLITVISKNGLRTSCRWTKI